MDGGVGHIFAIPLNGLPLLLRTAVINIGDVADHITEIGYWSFRDCTNLKSITIPNSVTVIGNSAFMGCSGLTSITIPSSVTTIEAWAFAGCRGLTSVFIPDSVTEIQVHALAGGNISDVYYGGTEEQWKAIAHLHLAGGAAEQNGHVPDAEVVGPVDLVDRGLLDHPVHLQGVVGGDGGVGGGPGSGCHLH